jgi:hypothetical protein
VIIDFGKILRET